MRADASSGPFMRPQSGWQTGEKFLVRQLADTHLLISAYCMNSTTSCTAQSPQQRRQGPGRHRQCGLSRAFAAQQGPDSFDDPQNSIGCSRRGCGERGEAVVARWLKQRWGTSCVQLPSGHRSWCGGMRRGAERDGNAPQELQLQTLHRRMSRRRDAAHPPAICVYSL